jgi:hypothetical protein
MMGRRGGGGGGGGIKESLIIKLFAIRSGKTQSHQLVRKLSGVMRALNHLKGTSLQCRSKIIREVCVLISDKCPEKNASD